MSIRVERGDGWEIRFCSCRGDLGGGNDVLLGCVCPEHGLATVEAFDHTITDAPYSRRTHEGVRSSKMLHDDRGARSGADTRRKVDLGFHFLTDELRSATCKEVGRTKRWVLAFADMEGQHDWMVDLETAGLRHWRFGVWRKLGAAPQFNGSGPAVSVEAIEVAHSQATMRWNGGGAHAYWECPIVLARGHKDGERVHSTQKPVALLETLVRQFTDPGDLIVDPFMGSGTTGVAAVRLGRRFIGWEVDEKHFDTALTRLQSTHQQIDFVGHVESSRVEQPRLPVVGEFLDEERQRQLEEKRRAKEAAREGELAALENVVVAVLRDYDGYLSAAMLKEIANVEPADLKVVLRRLCERGLLVKDGSSAYMIPKEEEATA